jgi:serine/threonine protein kinase
VDDLLSRIAAQSHFEDRYELREKLASGGMGHVLRAYDRILCREVAVKMMHGDDNSSRIPAIRGQFLKEARVGGRLLHPNVLPVFDLGVNRARQIYFTMRLVNGDSLQHSLEAVDRGVATRLLPSFPLRKSVEAFVEACQGVEYAHQNRIIHLDLKPHNILVSGFHEVFVIDWGLARVDEVDDTDELVDLYRNAPGGYGTASNTGVLGGRVVGTPGYMAPEQSLGNVPSYGPMSDVYGLGGILYFILYGKAPNQGRDRREVIDASLQPKREGTLRQGILPQGRRVQKTTRDSLAALQSICLKALMPEQKDRYPTVEYLIIDVNEWLSATVESSAPTGTPAMSVMSGKRRWWQFW